jgi:PAS domain S-box-containing protein
LTRLLVTEDSPTQATQLAGVLSAHGFDVACAANGEEGLVQLRQSEFDLVISDVIMPGMSGYEFCRQIKSDRRMHHIPVILLTSLREPMDIIRGLESGADNFIAKPYESNRLIARIETVLQNVSIRSRGKPVSGVEVVFLGERFLITSEREQVLDLLITTFEDIVRTHGELQKSKMALIAANREIERHAHEQERRVRERTAELFEQKRYLAQAQAIAHIGNWRLSIAHGLLEWSDEMYRIYGIAPDAGMISIEYMIRAICADDQSRFREAIERSIDRNTAFRDGFLVMRPNGDERYCWIEGDCQFDEQGRPEALFGICQDITERKLSEARVQEMQTELAHISRLTEMGQMASGLAHELNQPLAAAGSYLQALRRLLDRGDTDSLDRAKSAAETAMGEVRRTGEIIRSLRAFVKKADPERRVESLATLIEEANALALAAARERGVVVQFRPAFDLPHVLVDKVQIQQVLVNLLRNAVEAMEASPRRRISIEVGSGEDGLTTVAVIDTGPGIAPEVAKRLFQPFVTTKSQGMGVGLSLCRAIVEAHGGRLWAEPNPEGGTIFRFTIPIAGADVARVPEHA